MKITWATIHAERRALADRLDGLSAEQWQTPSLLAGWTVEDVLSHLVAGASMGPFNWFAGVLRHRFDFDAQSIARAAEHKGRNGDDTLRRFGAVVDSTTKPPLPLEAMLGEVLVHANDLGQPIGRERPVDPVLDAAVLTYYATNSMMFPGTKWADGLHLSASDGSLELGQGTLVSGPTRALLMSFTGRRPWFDQLEGPGVPVLRERVGLA